MRLRTGDFEGDGRAEFYQFWLLPKGLVLKCCNGCMLRLMKGILICGIPCN